jgi:hypothetical protein
VAGSCERGDNPLGSGATELLSGTPVTIIRNSSAGSHTGLKESVCSRYCQCTVCSIYICSK